MIVHQILMILLGTDELLLIRTLYLSHNHLHAAPASALQYYSYTAFPVSDQGRAEVFLHNMMAMDLDNGFCNEKRQGASTILIRL